MLPEVLLVMVLGTLLLGATLITFQRFVVHENESADRNDNVELARNSLDVEAKQLRNLAQRTTDPVIASPVTGDAFTFQTSDPTRTWVRYCLDKTNLANEKVWVQLKAEAASTTSSPITSAMQTGCPAASGWSSSRIVADHVVNYYAGRTRPMFSFRCAYGGGTCVNSTTTYDQLIGVDANLYLDTDPTDKLPEQAVTSGVYLRNQNQAPTAEFTATTITGTARTILFNASGSSDYEQRTLSFYWFLNSMPTAANIRCGTPPDTTQNTWGGTYAGSGLTFQYTWPGTTPAAGTSQAVGLVVCDPGDRPSSIVTRTVTIPN